MKKTRRPKKISGIRRIFYDIAWSEEQRTIFGDLDEMLADMIKEKGRLKAFLWYVRQLLSAGPMLLYNSFYWRFVMLINYLKISLRNLWRQKGYSFINIAGLAIGFACCVFILLWVQDELSYDRFHVNAENLYCPTFSNGSKVTPTALAAFLKTEYPEIIYASRYRNIGSNLLKYEDTEINENYGIMVDPDFLKMFTFHFLKGDAETALNDPASILISAGLAEKYFGKKEALGRIFTLNVHNKVKVTGVFKDYPLNSHIRCAYILRLPDAPTTWAANNIRTYVQVQAGAPVGVLNEKISDVVERHRPQDQRPLFLQRITQLHLNPFNHSSTPIFYVYLFSVMAVFVLLIACINFINLTTAKSTIRAKEIGIRKTVGANRSQLIRQFFLESLLMIALASTIGLSLVFLLLTQFNNLTGKSFTWEVMARSLVLLSIFGILLLTVILAGSYPSLVLARFQPVKVLKGKLRAGKKGSLSRKVLVVVQFSLSVLLILGTLMIFRQVHFLKEKEVGFDRDNIVYFEINSRFRQQSDVIKTELRANPNILNVTMTDVAPYRWMSNAGVGDVFWEGKADQRVKMVMINVDYDYLDTIGLEIAEGRFFNLEFSTDASEAYVVNQAAVRAMEMENPLGKELKVWERSGEIIGVVKDYHFESLHNPIIPMAMLIQPSRLFQACVRIAPHKVADTLAFLETKWEEVYPEYPFTYNFLDDTIAAQYRSEQSVGRIVTIFTVLALFISCLGVLGLSSYMTEQRTKEIGIRKVLGASVAIIIRQISKEFVGLVLAANLIAWPLAYYMLQRWLQTFAYRINMEWWTFIVTGIVVLLVSMLTISWQILRAATADPVESLRYE